MWIQTRQTPAEVFQLQRVLAAAQRDCALKTAHLVPGVGIGNIRVTALAEGAAATFDSPFDVSESLSSVAEGLNTYLRTDAPVDCAPALLVGTYFGSINGRLVVHVVDGSKHPAAALATLQAHLRALPPARFKEHFGGLEIEQGAVSIREV